MSESGVVSKMSARLKAKKAKIVTPREDENNDAVTLSEELMNMAVNYTPLINKKVHGSVSKTTEKQEDLSGEVSKLMESVQKLSSKTKKSPPVSPADITLQDLNTRMNQLTATITGLQETVCAVEEIKEDMKTMKEMFATFMLQKGHIVVKLPHSLWI
jgi:conjugal transfer/entry exclusion protein